MGTVIEFPDRPGAAEVAQSIGGFDQDVGHVVEAISAALPQAALNLISPEEMALAAARTIQRLDQVRAIRYVAQEQAWAAARAACEARSVEAGAQPDTGRDEYKALADMFAGRPPSDDPPGPAVA